MNGIARGGRGETGREAEFSAADARQCSAGAVVGAAAAAVGAFRARMMELNFNATAADATYRPWPLSTPMSPE